MAELTAVLLGAVLVFVFGWNNSAFLIGNGRGSGALTVREALLVSSVGLILGVVFEGSSMSKSLAGSLTPTATDQVVIIALAVSLVLTVALTLVKLPVSFSMVLVGAFCGAVIANNLPLNLGRVEEVVGFWAVAPLATALLAFLIMRLIVRSVSGLSLIALDGVSRYAVILTSFAVAYVLGANNIGLIYGTVVNGGSSSDSTAILFTLVAIAGMVALGTGGVSGTIGDRLLVLSPLAVVSTFLASAALLWLGTDLEIPISLTQCLIGGMFGAALSKQDSGVNTRLAAENVASWLVAPASALVLAFVLVRL
ncbi:MAG: inorganic phosphate transporter [Thaumarchaeota archaeon]|nr:inorganic phosphate transporter [Nitrososphaerota archaeon]